MATEIPSFRELVDRLRRGLAVADDLNHPSELHSFTTIMEKEAKAGLVADHFYHRAYDELHAQDHLDPASHKAMGGDARGRLSAMAAFTSRLDDEST